MKKDIVRSLFLDRDGVINSRIVGGYVRTWDQFEFLAGSLEAIVSFRKKFDRIFIITNQQGVGKGLMSSSEVDVVHQKMLEAISAAGGHIDKVYFCPELATGNPACRKPNTGMALQAQKDFPEVDFEYSIMVGDSASDMEMGRRLGMKLAFIEGKDEDTDKAEGMKLDWRVAALADLKEILIING